MKALATATAAILVLAAGACGGGDGRGGPNPLQSPSPSARATALTATAILPDLSGAGFVRQAPEEIPAPGGLDIVFAVYDRSQPPKATARAEVRLYPTEESARADFRVQAEGWRKPPPGLFGGDPGNSDGKALTGPDEARAYVASNIDPQGNRVWTDVFRVGRVVVVAHVLARDAADATQVRQAMIDSVLVNVRDSGRGPK